MEIQCERETIVKIQEALNSLEKEGFSDFKVEARKEWLGTDAHLLGDYPQGYITIKIFANNRCRTELQVCSAKNEINSLSEAISQINKYINK